jgi:hypothetical protein
VENFLNESGFEELSHLYSDRLVPFFVEAPQPLLHVSGVW